MQKDKILKNITLKEKKKTYPETRPKILIDLLPLKSLQKTREWS